MADPLYEPPAQNTPAGNFTVAQGSKAKTTSPVDGLRAVVLYVDAQLDDQAQAEAARKQAEHDKAWKDWAVASDYAAAAGEMPPPSPDESDFLKGMAKGAFNAVVFPFKLAWGAATDPKVRADLAHTARNAMLFVGVNSEEYQNAELMALQKDPAFGLQLQATQSRVNAAATAVVKKQVDETIDIFQNGTPEQKGEFVGGVVIGAFNVEALLLKGAKLAARATLLKAALKSCLACRTIADGSAETLSLASASNRLTKLEQSAPFLKAIAADQTFDAATREAIQQLLAGGEDIEIIALSDGKRIMTKGALSLDIVQRVQVHKWENYIVRIGGFKMSPEYGLPAAKATAEAAEQLTAGKSLRDVLGAAVPRGRAPEELSLGLKEPVDQIMARYGAAKPGLAVERQSLAIQLGESDSGLFGVPREADTMTPMKPGGKYESVAKDVPPSNSGLYTVYGDSGGAENLQLTSFTGNMMYHSPVASLGPAMDQAEKCFRRAMDRAAKPADIVQAVGEMHWWLSQAQPFYRGSAAISDWVTRAVLDARGFEVGALKPGIAADLKALPMSDPVAYGKQYPSFFESLTLRATLPPQHAYLRAFSYNGKIVKTFDPPKRLMDVEADVAKEATAVDATLPK
jgi:hypothetical protein